MFKMLTASVWV